MTDETLQNLYDVLKWGPTSANAEPARFAFLRTQESKARLRPALAPLNVERTMTAPVTVIVAYDVKFYEQLPKLFPHNPGMAKLFESSRHTWSAPQVPTPFGIDVTMGASTARENAIAPNHCWRVSTPP